MTFSKTLILTGAMLITLASCTTQPTGTASGDMLPPPGENRTARTIPIPTYGSGKHTLVQFSDFQCISCIQSEQSVVPIFEEYAEAGKLTIEYRQFPLTSIHPNAMGDALAALCAADQDAFMEYKKLLYGLEIEKRTAPSSTITNTERIALAQQLELDTDAFSQCLNQQEFREQVEADMAL